MEETIAAFDARLEAALAPFRDTVECLTQVPGPSTTAAEVVIAEIGLDISGSRPPGIFCPGRVWFPVSTRAPASAARPG